MATKRAELQAEIEARLAGYPQRIGLAHVMLDQAHDAINHLAGLGLVLRLDWADSEHPHAPDFEEYPKMLYHDMFPAPVTVTNEDMGAKMLKQGWRLTPLHTHASLGAPVPKPEPEPELPLESPDAEQISKSK